MDIKAFFDKNTYTLTYVVYDPQTKDAVVIDPVLDFDAASVTTSRESVISLMAFIKDKDLKVHYILETHAHADHLSGAHELVTNHMPYAKIGIGERIAEVQAIFKPIFNFPASFAVDGRQFAKLFTDDEEVSAGSLSFRVIFTPGHTPACSSYLFGDALFTGDSLFMPDYGTGRCDFPGGDAKTLYRSVTEKIYSLPDNTRIFVGHDYQPGGRPLRYETTVGESKEKNIHLRVGMAEAEFVAFRKKRDAGLAAPKLLFPSVQVNIAAGEFPEAESNGRVYLKLPLTVKESQHR